MRAFRLVVFSLLVLGVAQAQWTKTAGQRGFAPGAPFDFGNLDSVNMVNGNLIVTLPLASLPAGPGGQTAGVSVVYNSNSYNLLQGFTSTNPPEPTKELAGDTGWLLDNGLSYSLISEARTLPSGQGSCTVPTQNVSSLSSYEAVNPHETIYMFRSRLVFPDGSEHVLYLAGGGTPNGWLAQDAEGWTTFDLTGRAAGCLPNASVPSQLSGNAFFFTRDGTFVRATVNLLTRDFSVYFADGRIVSGNNGLASSVTDRNNNTLTLSNSTSCFPSPVPDPGGGQSAPTVSTLIGSNGRCIEIESFLVFGQRSYTVVRQRGVGQNELRWELKWEDVDLIFNYSCDKLDTVSGHVTTQTCAFTTTNAKMNKLTGIDFKECSGSSSCTTSHSYKFDYEPLSGGTTHGGLKTITLPTGGTISYTYHWNDQYLPHVVDVDTKTVSYRDPETTSTLVNEVYNYDIAGVMGACSTVTKPEAATSLQKWTYCAHPALTNGQLGGRTYKVQRPDGTTDETFWALNKALGGGDPNPYVVRELHSASGSTTMFAAKDYQVDVNGNVRVLKEYDYGSVTVHPDAIPNTLSASVLSPGTMALTRTTNTNYDYTVGPLTPFPLDTAANNPADAYWQSTAFNLRAPASVEVLNGGGVRQAYTTFEYQYDSNRNMPGYRSSANVSKEYRWDNTRGNYTATLTACPAAGCNAAMIERAYNAFGDVVDEWDADRRQTHYVYTSPAHPYPTDLYEAFNTGASRHWSFVWDANTGVRTSETDVDNSVTTTAEYDARGRMTLLVEGASGEQRKTRTTYTNPGQLPAIVSMKVKVESDLDSTGDFALSSTTEYDDLGRAWKTVNDKLGINTYTFTRAVPSQNGILTLVSNPFVTASDPTAGWTLTKTDVNGRIVAVTSYDGSAKPNLWPSGTNTSSTGSIITSYFGSSLGSGQTVIDQASKVKTLYTDGLGRLTRVNEAGSADTTYTYNALDNLTGVTQGTQGRTFTYSTLGRLTSAQNPEYCTTAPCAATMNYEYSAAGNLVKRTDPRGVITCFGVLTGISCDGTGYNERGQPTRTQYSDGTPLITQVYDGCGTYSKGRLCSTANSNSTTAFAYNSLGQITASTQTTPGAPGSPYNFGYQYKLNGQLSRVAYPSGRIVAYGFDAGGRVNRVANGELLSAPSYASSIQYAPSGGLSSMKVGVSPTLLNGIQETRQYNPRLQPTQIQIGGGLLTLAFDYNGSNNNGNVMSQDIYRNFGSQPDKRFRYAYDEFNRLKIAAADPSQALTGSTVCTSITSTWCQRQGYDQWGNRWLDGASGLPTATAEVPNSAGAFLSSNRLGNLGSGSWGYDAAGNVTSVPGPTGNIRTGTYDAENRQVSATNVYGETSTYSYDAQGRRVKKVSAGTTTIFVYDAAGQLAAEYGGPAPVDSGTRYLFSDHLGSTRLVLKADGTVDKTYDYLPFGEEIGGFYPGDTDTRGRQSTKFTGKERDAETGLDYFLARYYSAAQGRFTSPDEWAGGIVDPFTEGQVGQPGPLPYADITDPQTINKYAYVRNNPMRYIDPNGHSVEDFGEGVWDGSVGPLVSALSNPRATLVGLWDAASHPLDTAIAIKGSLLATGQGVMAGDHRAIGEVTGSIAMTLLTAGAGKLASTLAKGAEVSEAASSLYKATTIGSSVANRATTVTRAEFIQNLAKSGWKKSVSKDGLVVNMEKDGAKYSIREVSKSKGPTADYYKAGSNKKKADLKIRLEEANP